jgi:hypothetical protein
MLCRREKCRTYFWRERNARKESKEKIEKNSYSVWSIFRTILRQKVRMTEEIFSRSWIKWMKSFFMSVSQKPIKKMSQAADAKRWFVIRNRLIKRTRLRMKLKARLDLSGIMFASFPAWNWRVTRLFDVDAFKWKMRVSTSNKWNFCRIHVFCRQIWQNLMMKASNRTIVQLIKNSFCRISFKLLFQFAKL